MSITDRTEVDADIRGFSDEQLLAVITLAEMMLRLPADVDMGKRDALARRLEMFRAEKAVRDNTASNLDAWERIIAKSQAVRESPFD